VQRQPGYSAAITGQEVEDEHGDEIRTAESEEYMRLIGEVRPMKGARDLITALKDRGHTVVLASSAKEDEVDVYLDLLDVRELVDAWTTSADVESTKPAPDLVQAALKKSGGEPSSAVMVGDTPWDVEAAGKAGLETIAVITGGFSEQELTKAGAATVVESVGELLKRLDDPRLK